MPKFKIRYEYAVTKVIEIEADTIDKAQTMFLEGNNTNVIRDYEIDKPGLCIIDIDEAKEQITERKYTEKQYKEYSDLMEKMANNDDIIEGARIHYEIKQWLVENNITDEMEEQMDNRMEEEFEDEIKSNSNKSK
jgi:hypothetical protein